MIYRRDYWDAARCGQLPPFLAVAVFEKAVNQGVRTAVMMLQEALGGTSEVELVTGPLRCALGGDTRGSGAWAGRWLCNLSERELQHAARTGRL